MCLKKCVKNWDNFNSSSISMSFWKIAFSAKQIHVFGVHHKPNVIEPNFASQGMTNCIWLLSSISPFVHFLILSCDLLLYISIFFLFMFLMLCADSCVRKTFLSLSLLHLIMQSSCGAMQIHSKHDNQGETNHTLYSIFFFFLKNIELESMGQPVQIMCLSSYFSIIS